MLSLRLPLPGGDSAAQGAEDFVPNAFIGIGTDGQVVLTNAICRNDRVRCQACFQGVPVRSMALSVTTSLRMQAVSASFEGFPAWRSRL